MALAAPPHAIAASNPKLPAQPLPSIDTTDTDRGQALRGPPKGLTMANTGPKEEDEPTTYLSQDPRGPGPAVHGPNVRDSRKDGPLQGEGLKSATTGIVSPRRQPAPAEDVLLQEWTQHTRMVV